MPLIKVVRKGITPTVRKVPTSTAAAMLPMTMGRLGAEAASETEELTKVEDVGDAFKKFEPKLNFRASAPSRTSIRKTCRSVKRSRTRTARPTTCATISRT